MATEDIRTPEGVAERRVGGITEAQKQALISNLQLEISERARKLRAQYVLQAQSLRTRLEMRVNRIPHAFRKKNMQDLMDEDAEKSRPAPPSAMPAAATLATNTAGTAQKKSSAKRKRQVTRLDPECNPLTAYSDAISATDDKENVPSESVEDLANPKKRAKTNAATANTKASRTASRKIGPSEVLSPRSNNSRTLPRSPLKAASNAAERTQSRPIRAMQTSKDSSKPASRTASRQVAERGRAPSQQANETRGSDASSNSAITTIVSKSNNRIAAPRKGNAAKKTTAVTSTTKASSAARKAVAKHDSAPPAASGRTLRKRN